MKIKVATCGLIFRESGECEKGMQGKEQGPGLGFRGWGEDCPLWCSLGQILASFCASIFPLVNGDNNKCLSSFLNWDHGEKPVCLQQLGEKRNHEVGEIMWAKLGSEQEVGVWG